MTTTGLGIDTLTANILVSDFNAKSCNKARVMCKLNAAEDGSEFPVSPNRNDISNVHTNGTKRHYNQHHCRTKISTEKRLQSNNDITNTETLKNNMQWIQFQQHVHLSTTCQHNACSTLECSPNKPNNISTAQHIYQSQTSKKNTTQIRHGWLRLNGDFDTFSFTP